MEVINLSFFPEPVLNLPEADIPLNGIKAFFSQGQNHQIIFMEFAEDVDLPEHSHESQWGHQYPYLVLSLKSLGETPAIFLKQLLK